MLIKPSNSCRFSYFFFSYRKISVIPSKNPFIIILISAIQQLTPKGMIFNNAFLHFLFSENAKINTFRLIPHLWHYFPDLILPVYMYLLPGISVPGLMCMCYICISLHSVYQFKTSTQFNLFNNTMVKTYLKARGLTYFTHTNYERIPLQFTVEVYN